MKLLTRYVLREFLVPLGYCLAGLVLLFVVFELFGSFSRISTAGLPASTVARYFAGILSPHFRWLAPAALIHAAIYTMWTFCRHSEVVAMRASGVSFFAIVKPLLFAALGVAALVAWVDESYVPSNAQWASRLKTEHFDLNRLERTADVLYRNSRDMRMWSAESAEDGAYAHLLAVKVTIERPGGALAMRIDAKRADYMDGEWWVTEPRVQHYDGRGAEVATPTPELDSLKLRVFPEFRERPGDILSQNRNRMFSSVREKLRFARVNRDISDEERRECLYDAWAQALAPLACLVMTLFAIPAGIASGRQSVFRGVVGAIAMFFSFYGLYMLGMVMAYKGWLHHVPAALLPHVVFLLLGLRSFMLKNF